MQTIQLLNMGSHSSQKNQFMPNPIKSVRGTRDLLPPETETWNVVESAGRALFRLYNFQEIRTPILEDLHLFQPSVGEETALVSKERFARDTRPALHTHKAQRLPLH